MATFLKHVVVVGGGASGLMAAGMAARHGCQVTVLERNRDLGRKLLISGKGRCNITNNTDVPGLERNIPGNPRFLRHAFHRFTPQDVMSFFSSYGVSCKTERGGRVFPDSDNAGDVVRALIDFCQDHQVRLQTGATVRTITVNDGNATGITLENGVHMPADRVILATGGSSYPGTGSKGDGYRMAAHLGHTIMQLRPSLVPLETAERWPADAQGLSLRNVRVTLYDSGGKKRYSDVGEMLFTHYGVSGPLVLTASRHADGGHDCRMVIDLKPGLDEATLDARVMRDFDKYRRREFENALGDLLPRSLIPVILRLCGIAGNTFVHQVTRTQRLALVRLLKQLSLTITKPRGFEEAIVTAGGVSTKEIDPHTLESRLIQGLFFTGEVIDVDGYTGGFNLQIAWATGYLAGVSV